MSCSRVAMKATALAFPFTAAAITGGAFVYSAKRSSQVLSTTEWTRTILPEMSPAFAKSAALPLPTSITGTCFDRSERGRPRDGDAAHAEVDFGNLRQLGIERSSGGADRHLGCAFGPGIRDGEFFGVDAVGSGGFEHLHAPVDGVLHGGSAGNAAADFVGEVAQVAFEGEGCRAA